MKAVKDAHSFPSSHGTDAQPREDLRGGVPCLECRQVASTEDLAAHYAVRRQVFVREQRLFAIDDRDERDDAGDVVHVVGLVDGRVRGAVRLYPLDRGTGLWKGDRLAVLDGHRGHGLGAPLVRFAVQTAGHLGGREMLAYVQPGNVRFFEHLGWRRVGEPEEYVGVPHQRMVITPPRMGGQEAPSPTHE